MTELLTDLYETYHAPLVAVLSRWMPPEDARDVAQETFVNVLRSIDRYQGKSRWGYLLTTATNLARNRWRDEKAQRRDKEKTASLEVVGDVRDKTDSAEKRLIQEEQAALFSARFRQGLATFSESTRLCFLLRLRGTSSEEIAAATGLTNQAVRSRLSDARDKLQAIVGTEWRDIDWKKVIDDEYES
jgi:RNA polymerase sigma factor (sigma-70 family)